jgi:hypothetical protein
MLARQVPAAQHRSLRVTVTQTTSDFFSDLALLVVENASNLCMKPYIS